MNKQELIKQEYKYIATQNNNTSKIELWAKKWAFRRSYLCLLHT